MKHLIATATILLVGTMSHFACTHKASLVASSKETAPAVATRQTELLVIPAVSNMPAHVLFTQTDLYQFAQGSRLPFKKEISLNPLMQDAKLKAELLVNNKVIKVFESTKGAQTNLSNKQNTWTPGHAKLSIMIPFVAPNQEVRITTSYAWMDPRWTWPVYLEGPEPTLSSSLSVDVPFGVVMHYRTAKDNQIIPLIPKDSDQSHKIWGEKSNQNGLGTRYFFDTSSIEKLSAKNPGQRLQAYFSFDLSSQNERLSIFNNWSAVSSYLYNRMDSYDLPSAAIRDFALKECSTVTSDHAKILKILSFLEHEIERKASLGSFMEQDLQTAQTTFDTRLGSDYDAATLGKSMLSGVGIDANLLVVATPEQNPLIDDFFSPSLFYKVILLIKDRGKDLYWDPSEASSRLDRVPLTLQGQGALVLVKEKGHYLKLPFIAPEENQSHFAYDLELDAEGYLKGSFSLNLINIKAEKISEKLAQQESMFSAKELQEQIKAGDDALLWQSASLLKQKDQANISISGQLATKQYLDNNSQINIAISDILKPVLSTLLQTNTHDVASHSSVQARIKLPAHFRVEQEPIVQNLNALGLAGNFSLSLKNDTLILSGRSVVSLPQGKDFAIKADTQYKKLQSFNDYKIAVLQRDSD